MIEYQCKECGKLYYSATDLENLYFPDCQCGGKLTLNLDYIIRGDEPNH